MNLFLITTGVFLIVLTIMSVGVIFARKPIQGSCGGLSALSGKVGQPLCEVCGGDPAKRPKGCDEPLPDLGAPSLLKNSSTESVLGS